MKTKKLVFYKDKKGEYRWRVIAANGRVLADSGEGYKTVAKCCRGFSGMFWTILMCSSIDELREAFEDAMQVIDETKGKNADR